MSPEPWQPSFLLLTCEHGGREVPVGYEGIFREAEAVLGTHRGYDIGAMGVAIRMASTLAAPIVFSTITRLLIDLNRSLDHPDAYSEFSRCLPAAERARIAAAFYTPHRETVSAIVAAMVASGQRVLHVGVHSCADVLSGEQRDFDVAMLLDLERPGEVSICERWRSELLLRAPGSRSPFNEPYLGTDDGLTTTLRSRFPAASYAGVEIELRQGAILEDHEQLAFADLLAGTLRPLIGGGSRVSTA